MLKLLTRGERVGKCALVVCPDCTARYSPYALVGPPLQILRPPTPALDAHKRGTFAIGCLRLALEARQASDYRTGLGAALTAEFGRVADAVHA
jgi:hypothetical protein